MSLFNLFKSPKSHRRSRGRGRTGRSQTRGASAPSSRARSEPSPSYWDSLSPERKLDVIGIVLIVAGILVLVGLLSTSPSALTGGVLKLLGQLIGWGIYFLPAGLILFGLWLVLRKIERIPPPSPERAGGTLLVFLWALTLMHSIVAAPEMAVVAARDGAGGGYIGGLFERLLWFGLGPAGLIIALLAWLLLALTMILDMRIQHMLAWIGPFFARFEAFLHKPILPEPAST